MVGVTAIGEHTIAKGSESHIISLVRDKLYPNPDKAALCETICNAIDEHRKHAVKRPVDVVITKTEVVVRDYAKGLSQDDVVNIFFAFGASTKKDSEDAIGGFGIGAKAPSAYAQSWTVESRYKGKHSGYMTTLNGSKGVIGKLFEKDCPLDDTGITVRFPLKKSEHFDTFLKLALDMYLQVGFFNDEEELRVYSAAKIPSYNDFLFMLQQNPDCIDEFDAVKQNKLKPWKELRKSNPHGQYIENVGFMLPCLNRWENSRDVFDRVRSFTFIDNLSSDFFRMRGGSVKWLYDGDMLYKIPGNTSLRGTGTFIEAKCSNWRTECITILFIPKSKFQIAPSRETLISTTELENYMQSQYRKLHEAYEDRLFSDANKTFADENNDYLSAMNHLMKYTFFPFRAEQLPFYPRYDSLFAVNYLQAAYVISDGRTLIFDKIDQKEDFNLQDNIDSIQELSLEKVTNNRINNSGYSHRGVILNIVCDPKDKSILNTRLARAAVMWFLDNMTDAQREILPHLTPDGIFVGIYWVKGVDDPDSPNYNSIPSIKCTVHISSVTVHMFPDHTWLRLHQLEPYLEQLQKHITSKYKELAKVKREKKKTLDNLYDLRGNLIPETKYANTLLIAPSQMDEYLHFRQIFANQSTGYEFVAAMLESLNVQYIAECSKANMKPYINRGARTIDSIDLAKTGYAILKDNKFKYMPSVLKELLNIRNTYKKVLESIKNEAGYEFDDGIYRKYACHFSNIQRLLNNLPGNSKLPTNISQEFVRLDNHVLETFAKLSMSDKITLHDAAIFEKAHANGMLSRCYVDNEAMYNKIDERTSKLLDKAEAIIINKLMPKLNLVWSPDLDHNNNTENKN